MARMRILRAPFLLLRPVPCVLLGILTVFSLYAWHRSLDRRTAIHRNDGRLVTGDAGASRTLTLASHGGRVQFSYLLMEVRPDRVKLPPSSAGRADRITTYGWEERRSEPSPWGFMFAERPGYRAERRSFLGFGLFARKVDWTKADNLPFARLVIRWEYGWTAYVPWWFITLVVATPAARGARVSVRRASRVRSGRCLRCGYDLRESKGRCPECGKDSGSA